MCFRSRRCRRPAATTSATGWSAGRTSTMASAAGAGACSINDPAWPFELELSLARGALLPALLAGGGRLLRRRAGQPRQCRAERARGGVARARHARARAGRGDAPRHAAGSAGETLAFDAVAPRFRQEQRADDDRRRARRSLDTKAPSRCCPSRRRSRTRSSAGSRRTSRCRCGRAATWTCSGSAPGTARPASPRSARRPSSRRSRARSGSRSSAAG